METRLDESRFARMKALLLAARERAGEARARYLAAECTDDPELRAEVEALLARESDDAGILRTAGPIQQARLPLEDVTVPRQIGPYEIVEELGRGGMGIVLRARQTEPIQREVAVKLMGVHILTESMRLRFDAERQTLASLDHPNIAHVIDAGTEESGRPYLVMELVVGEPITDYCDARRLPVDERLDLFLEVSDAVSHAHQRGILHRDLKPSNVMVTTDGDHARVKVIDFGIAKVIGEQEEAAGLTRAGQLIGTPDFMSPEQAGIIDAPVDTRTDVYALGILLYELLAGARPYYFSSGQVSEFLRILDSEGPPTPSAVAGGRSNTVGGGDEHSTEIVAERRRATVAELSRHLRGDLDAIALHALRTHPDQRYGSVDRLADDILRHRAGLPVEAREGGLGYRATKFVRRHVAAVVAAVLVLAGTVGVIVTVTAQRDRALRAQRVAAAEAETARRVSDFLVELFEVADPSEARGNAVTAREILDRGVTRIDEELRAEPEVRARLLDAMGRVYQSLGLFSEAEPLLGEALALRRELPEGETPDLAQSVANYAFVLTDLGEYARAESLYLRAVDLNTRLLGDRHAETASALAGLASLYTEVGDIDAAEPLLERVLEIELDALGGSHPYVAMDYNNMASIRMRRGDYAGAVESYKQALAINLDTSGSLHPETATNYANLGIAFGHLSELDSAIAYDRRALELREELLGAEHAFTGISANNLGGHLHAMGRYEEALPLLERALAIKRATQGPRHRSTAHAMLGLGRLLRDMGDPDRAKPLLLEALAIHRETVGDVHPGTSMCLVALARLELARGDAAAATAYAREAVKMRREHSHDLARRADAELVLARALDVAGDPDEAAVHAARASELFREKLGGEHARVAEAESVLTTLRRRAGASK